MDQQEELDYEGMYDEDSQYNAEGDEHWSELLSTQQIESQQVHHFGQNQAMQQHMLHAHTASHEAMYGSYPPQYMTNYNTMPVNFFGADSKVLGTNVPNPSILSDASLQNVPLKNNVPALNSSKESSIPSFNSISAANVPQQKTQSWQGHGPVSQSSYFADKLIPNNTCVVTSNLTASVPNSSFSNTGGSKTSSNGNSKLNSLLNQTNATATNHTKGHSNNHANPKNKFTPQITKIKTAHYSPYPKMSKETLLRKENGSEKNSTAPDPHQIMDRITQARNELKNLRQSVRGLSAQHKTDVHHLEGLLHYSSPTSKPSGQCNGSQTTAAAKHSPSDQSDGSQKNKFNPLFQNWKPIGFMESSYMHKNGTPRQGCLVRESRGKIRILDALYTNPSHSLHGLDQHSHVWLMFAFDRNSKDPSGNSHSKAKVAPPRLGGARLGVFATRSPHRPCPIGLTLVKLEAVEGSTVHVSGVDILFGTAILDIKPYIPDYDAPQGYQPDMTRERLMESIRDASTLAGSEDKSGVSSKNSENGLGCSFLRPAIKNSQASAGEAGRNGTVTKKMNTSSKGIVITKLAPSSDYEHLLAKVSGLETSPSSSSGAQNTEGKKLSTSEQLRNAERESEALGSLLRSDNSGDFTVDHVKNGVKTAKWLQEADRVPLNLIFNPIADRQLERIIPSESERISLRSLIGDTLRCDPRSVYRRQRCPDLLYRCRLAAVTVTAAFLDEESAVEVLRIVAADRDVHTSGDQEDEATMSAGQPVGL